MSCTDGNCPYRTERGGLVTNGGCKCRKCPACGGVYISTGVRHSPDCPMPEWTPPPVPKRKP